MDKEKKETIDGQLVERKGFNITSMILGIIAVVFLLMAYVSLPCAIIAIIFAIAGRHDAGKGMGTAGLVLGIVALALLLLLFVFGAFIVAARI